MKSFRALSALLLIGALVAGATPLARTQTPSLPGYPAAGAPPIVKLLVPGAEPRAALRYTIAANSKARADMTMNMSMAMNIAGMSMPMNMPGMKMSVDIAVTNVAPNGDFTYNLAFTSFTMDTGGEGNPLAAALQTVQSTITSIKGSATVSNRGVTKSSKMDVTDPTVAQTLGQMTSEVQNFALPFPEEAVGVGARWEVRQATTSGGQTMFAKTTYEITSIAGSAVTLTFKTEQNAPPQSISNPNLPAGAEIYLDKMTGAGDGKMVVRLDSLVPTSEMTSTSSMSMTMNMGGQSQPMASDNTIKITIAPGK